MKATCAAVVGLVLVTAAEARAANKLIAVLPLDVSMTSGKMSKEAQASLEEMLRDVSTDSLAPGGWTILTGETTIQVLKDNGVRPEECGGQDCHLANARELKADKFISGAVQYVEGEFTASIRLIDTGTGRILASERVRGKTVKELTTGFEGKAAEFFRKGGLVEGPAVVPPAAPVPASAASVPAATPAVAWAGTFTSGGVEWQTNPPKRETKGRDAVEYCARLSLAGGRWRLPTKDELLDLFDAKGGPQAVERYPGMDGLFFYASLPESADQLDAVNFKTGKVIEGVGLDNSANLFVRCARSPAHR